MLSFNLILLLTEYLKVLINRMTRHLLKEKSLQCFHFCDIKLIQNIFKKFCSSFKIFKIFPIANIFILLNLKNLSLPHFLKSASCEGSSYLSTHYFTILFLLSKKNILMILSIFTLRFSLFNIKVINVTFV